LEAVVAWSYDLLSLEDRRAFRRLAVFADSFDLDGAEALVGNEALDAVTRLTERSLLTTVKSEDAYRYAMLETLRQYGRERLVDEGETGDSRQRLIAWALGWVDRLERDMRTPRQDASLRDTIVERANLRVAYEHACEHGDEITALRLVSAIPILPQRERRAAIESLLPAAEAAGHALLTVANCAFEESDWAAGVDAAQRAETLFARQGDRRLVLWSRYFTVIGSWGADSPALDGPLAGVVDGFRELGDDLGLAYSLWIASQRVSDLEQGDAWAAEAEDLFRALGSPIGLAHDIEGRALIALARGRCQDAVPLLAEALDAFHAAANPGCTAHTIEAVAAVVATVGDPDEAAVLLGAAERLRNLSGHGHRPWEREARRRTEELLGSADISRSRALGATLTLDESVRRAHAALLSCGEARVS
jgi:hypothetical protein